MKPVYPRPITGSPLTHTRTLWYEHYDGPDSRRSRLSSLRHRRLANESDWLDDLVVPAAGKVAEDWLDAVRLISVEVLMEERDGPAAGVER